MTGWREQPPIAFGEVPAQGRLMLGLDRPIEGVMIGMLAFMPFALGAVQPWSEAIVMAASALLAAMLVVRVLATRGPSLPWSWTFVPLVLFVALVAAQLVPLPASWMRIVSPHTWETKRSLLADVPNASTVLRRLTLSFYPLATRHDLRTVLAAATMFMAVLTVIRSHRQIVRLLVVIVCVGAAVALLAAAQDLASADKIFWFIPTPRGVANAGPFVLYNNFAQFMNLSMGAAVGLLLYVCVRGPRAAVHMLHGRNHDRGRQGGRWEAPPGWVVWSLGLFLVLGAVTVLIAGSRGGILSMFAAFFGTLVLVGRGLGLKRQGWLLFAIGTAVFAVVLYVSFDAVCDRLATLHNRPDPSSGRIGSFADIARVWERFPVWGTGLGTHQYVYPAYDRSDDAGLGEQADGDYVQAAEETGGVGLAIILLFAGLVWWDFGWIIARGGRDRAAAALVVGLGYGLVAVMLHSLTDFGQHLPAIACLSAAYCGLIVRLAHPLGTIQANGENEGTPQVPAWSGWSQWLPGTAGSLVIAGLLLGGMLWAIGGAERARRADAFSTEADQIINSTGEGQAVSGGGEDEVRLLTLASAAVAAEPDDVTYRYYLNWYRWRAVASEADAQKGMATLAPGAVGFAARIVDELHQARVLCPTYGPICSVAGQLEYFVLGRTEEGQRHAALGYALWPNHPVACLASASVDAALGRWDDAALKMRRCLQLDGQFFPQVLQVLLYQHNRPDVALAVCGDNSGRLLELSRRLGDVGISDKADAKKAQDQALAQLRIQCEQQQAPAWLLAQTAYLCRDRNQLDNALDFFNRALATDYSQVDWHFATADVLHRLGRYDDAVHEARVCLRLRPRMPEALQLIADLSVLPGMHADASGH